MKLRWITNKVWVLAHENIQKENIRRVVKPSVHCIVHGQRRLCILHLNKFQFILCKLPFRFCTTKIYVLKYVIRVCIWMHIHDQLIRNQSCLSEIYVSLGLNFQNTTIISKHNFLDMFWFLHAFRLRSTCDKSDGKKISLRMQNWEFTWFLEFLD